MMPDPTVAERLSEATGALLSCSDSPRLDAEILLGMVLGRTRSGLIAHGDERLAPHTERAFSSLLEARCRGMPVAYLTGSREFWSLSLAVTPAVLVPRPETELLVELALAHLPVDRECAVLDLGTGSGAIALAIAKERPRARVTGTDVSQPALDIAAGNSKRLGLSQIVWRQGSWFDAVPGQRFDYIVANPPYVAANDPALQSLHAEPLLALTPGLSGLEAFRAIIAAAPAHLREGGRLGFEHGRHQAGDVAQLLTQQDFAEISTHADAAGLPRVTLARFHASPPFHPSRCFKSSP